MIHEDKLKLNTALLEAKELKERNDAASNKILDDLWQVSESNPHINFSDGHASLKTQFGNAQKPEDWDEAKAELILKIENIIGKFCQ